MHACPSLRVAEASNPKFAFLQPEHPNHAYFRKRVRASVRPGQ